MSRYLIRLLNRVRLANPVMLFLLAVMGGAWLSVGVMGTLQFSDEYAGWLPTWASAPLGVLVGIACALACWAYIMREGE